MEAETQKMKEQLITLIPMLTYYWIKNKAKTNKSCVAYAEKLY